MTHDSPSSPKGRVLSHGGGLDSAGMLRDAIRRGDLPTHCVHVNTGAPGDPGEWPGTRRFLEEVERPLCEAHGIEFIVIEGADYPVRGARSLFAWLSGDRGPGKSRAAVQIPVTGPGRICTIVAKVERFERWLDDTFPGEEVEVWIGFDAAESGRAAKDPNAGKGRKVVKPGAATRRNRFPLIEQGLCRCRCEALVRETSGMVPRKSACVYCPYGSKADWQTFADELPEEFAKIVALEARKPPTKAGKKLSIMGYSADKLTTAAHRALVRLNKWPDAVINAGTLTALRKRELVVQVHGGGPNAGTVGHLLTPTGIAALLGGVGHELGYTAPPLPEYIQGAAKSKAARCTVCGAPKATKRVGCGYLES